MHFDVCVIGAGPSGIAAAMRSIDLGHKVLLIEKGKVGGAGVFNGALASKTPRRPIEYFSKFIEE